jgi:hypothetical protein
MPPDAARGGYNFVSGPLADITLITAFVGTLYLFLRRHNCNVRHCWRMAWHPTRRTATRCARSTIRTVTGCPLPARSRPLGMMSLHP